MELGPIAWRRSHFPLCQRQRIAVILEWLKKRNPRLKIYPYKHVWYVSNASRIFKTKSNLNFEKKKKIWIFSDHFFIFWKKNREKFFSIFFFRKSTQLNERISKMMFLVVCCIFLRKKHFNVDDPFLKNTGPGLVYFL